MPNWLKKLFCKHKYHWYLGYGHIPRYGIGTYEYEQCDKCGKIKGSVKNFIKDEDM